MTVAAHFTVFLGDSDRFMDNFLGFGARNNLDREFIAMPMTMPIRILTAAIVFVAAVQVAQGAEWQYCLAPSQDTHTIFVSPAFPVRGDIGVAYGLFGATLDRRGLPRDDVQCPRADDESTIATMRQYAIEINQRNGNAIVRVPLEK